MQHLLSPKVPQNLQDPKPSDSPGTFGLPGAQLCPRSIKPGPSGLPARNEKGHVPMYLFPHLLTSSYLDYINRTPYI